MKIFKVKCSTGSVVEPQLSALLLQNGRKVSVEVPNTYKTLA